MTVLIEKHRLLVTTTPKVACTSIKTALFEVENGFPFRNFHANGRLRHIHDPALYPARGFIDLPSDIASTCLRLTVVRDPLRRFLSAYGNRVLFYRELDSHHIGSAAAERGVPTDPSLSDFVRHIEVYREISPSIRLHTEPATFFIGADAGFYDQIFDVSALPEFEKVVAGHLGRPFQLPRLQEGGPKLSPDDLSAQERAKLRKIYERDTDAFGRFMAIERGNAHVQ